ncbi:histone-lysine N-methyltransferase SETMAR [Trichonephila clavipes]|nr:histone-lysine N-methyltransferase SETMAR [Trichonephila clavipes]
MALMDRIATSRAPSQELGSFVRQRVSAQTVRRYESKFCLLYKDGSIRVWWHCGERTLPGYIRHRHTVPSPRVMAWDAIGCSALGADTVIANYVQVWFRRFRSGIFDVKDAPRTGRPTVEKVGKITEIIEVDRHVSSHSMAQELKFDHKIVLSHLHKVGFKKKLHVWVPHQLTPKNIMDRISICEALAKWNEIDPFLKWMVTGMRNGSHTTILCENDCGESTVKQLKRWL